MAARNRRAAGENGMKFLPRTVPQRTVYASPRVAKLFCAAGIPFLYAYEDLSLDTRTPFALKLANLDAPVRMELVGEFVWRCRLNPHLARAERKFAESNYDWRVMMKRILEFTATGRRGV